MGYPMVDTPWHTYQRKSQAREAAAPDRHAGEFHGPLVFGVPLAQKTSGNLRRAWCCRFVGYNIYSTNLPNISIEKTVTLMEVDHRPSLHIALSNMWKLKLDCRLQEHPRAEKKLTAEDLRLPLCAVANFPGSKYNQRFCWICVYKYKFRLRIPGVHNTSQWTLSTDVQWCQFICS